MWIHGSVLVNWQIDGHDLPMASVAITFCVSLSWRFCKHQGASVTLITHETRALRKHHVDHQLGRIRAGETLFKTRSMFWPQMFVADSAHTQHGPRICNWQAGREVSNWSGGLEVFRGASHFDSIPHFPPNPNHQF